METELKITKERVLSAVEKCPTVKETLKELFPEVFEKQYKDYDLLFYKDTRGINYIRIIKGNKIYNLDNDIVGELSKNIPNYTHVGNLFEYDGAEKLKKLILENFSK